MKKTYIQPTTKEFKVRLSSMLATSPGFDDTTGNGSDEAAKDDTIDDFDW